MVRLLNNNHGFSILSAMMGSMIVTITIVGFAQYMATQQKTMQGMNQKFEALKFQQALVRTMADPASCSCLMNPVKSGMALKVNKALAQTAGGFDLMGLDRVPGGCDAGSTSLLAEEKKFVKDNKLSGLYVQEIGLEEIEFLPSAVPTTSDQYRGTLKVYFGRSTDKDAAKLTGYIKPATAEVIFNADPAGNVIDCDGADLDDFFADKVLEATTDINTVVTNVTTTGQGQVDDLVSQMNQDTDDFVRNLNTQKDEVVEAARVQGQGIVDQANRDAAGIIARAESDGRGIIAQATSDGQDIVNNANNQAATIINQANQTAGGIISAANGRAAEIIRAANAEAARIIAEAGSSTGDGGGGGDGGVLPGKPVIVQIDNLGSGVIRVYVSNDSVPGVTGWEILINGHNKGSVGASSGSTTSAVIGTNGNPGSTVSVTAAGSDDARRRSQPSDPWNYQL